MTFLGIKLMNNGLLSFEQSFNLIMNKPQLFQQALQELSITHPHILYSTDLVESKKKFSMLLLILLQHNGKEYLMSKFKRHVFQDCILQLFPSKYISPDPLYQIENKSNYCFPTFYTLDEIHYLKQHGVVNKVSQIHHFNIEKLPLIDVDVSFLMTILPLDWVINISYYLHYNEEEYYQKIA